MSRIIFKIDFVKSQLKFDFIFK